MKPIEETWVSECGAAGTTDDGQSYNHTLRLSGAPDWDIIARFYDSHKHGLRVPDPEDSARVRLAAQAPAMARLLLKLQWIDVDRGEGCPSCGAWKSDGHAADCEIAAVLKVAGVTS